MTAANYKTKYDDANYTVRREHHSQLAATASVIDYFMAFQKIKLHAIHVRVVAAGTTTTAGFTLYKVGTATTTSSAVTLGTSAAGVTTSIELGATLGTSVASLNEVRVAKSADATMELAVNYEYSVLPDALQSP